MAKRDEADAIEPDGDADADGRWLLSADEAAALAELDAECNGDRSRDFLWWRGAVAEENERGERQRAAVYAVSLRVGPRQRLLLGASAWERAGFDDAGRQRWRLVTVIVRPDRRRDGIGQASLNGRDWGDEAAVYADVRERDLVSQQFLSACGWHGWPTTKLDGKGWLRFEPALAPADFDDLDDDDAVPPPAAKPTPPPQPAPQPAATE